MMIPRLVKYLCATALALTLVACASTQLRSTWRADDYAGPPLKKVAIFVLNEDENMRRFAEDQTARSFPKGTAAVPSYKLFSQPEKDVDKVKDRLSREGFDGVLMASTISIDRSREYVPPQTVSVPTGPVLVGPVFSTNPQSQNLDVFYSHVWGYTYQTMPGYTADVTTVVIETVLYGLPAGQPLWSGVSETRNPASKAETVAELSKLVEKELSRAGLIGGK